MATITAMSTFIGNVERLLKDRSLTQAAFAEMVGTKQPAVSKILRGEEELTLSRAEKWARALGVDLHELVCPHEFVK